MTNTPCYGVVPSQSEADVHRRLVGRTQYVVRTVRAMSKLRYEHSHRSAPQSRLRLSRSILLVYLHQSESPFCPGQLE